MKVSIIIPTYNSQETLENTLISVINQSFQNWELLIIDGLSNDNTLLVAQKYSKKDSRIKIYSEADKGIYDAMNKGIRMAKGEWLYFLGSDDVLYHSKVLEEIFSDPQILMNDLVYGNVKIKDTGFIHRYEFDLFKLYHQNICHQAIFTKKKVFEELGGFDTRFQQLADWDFNIRCWLEPSLKKKYIPIIVALYNNKGTSAQVKDEEFLGQKELLQKKIFTFPNRIKRKVRQGLYKLLASVN